jgi:hypothetical protein
MENINFNKNHAGFFTNKLDMTFESAGQQVILKDMTSYKGILATITQFFNISVKITDATGQCYIVNKKKLTEGVNQSGLNENEVHSIIHKFKLSNKIFIPTIPLARHPQSSLNATTTITTNPSQLEQPNPPKIHDKVDEPTVKTDQVNSRVVSEYKIVKKSYSKEEIEKLLPMPEENDPIHLDGKPIISTQLMDLIKSGKMAILPHFNPKKISSQQVVQLLRICVERQDRNGLRLLAQVLFNGDRKDALPSHSIDTLRRLFFHPAVDEMCIARMMVKAFEDRKQDYKRPPTVSNRQQVNGMSSYDNPDETVKISHGGGLDNIRKFLNHETDGYQLEANAALGLQVSIDWSGRDDSYANGAWRHFDLPAVLTAEVEREHLHPANNSSYEAGLSSPHVSSLKNAHIRLIETPYVINSYVLDNLERDFGEDIATAVANSVQDFNQRNNFQETPKEIHGLSIRFFETDPDPTILEGLNKIKEASFMNNRIVTTAQEE